AAVADLFDLRVEPQVGVAAFERAVAKRLDLLVEPLADPRDLALGDPDPERLDHLVDLPSRDTGDVGLLHDRDQRLLTALARLEETGEVGAAADLRDRQLDLAGARRPRTRSVAVAVGEPLLRHPLAEAGADQLRHLRLHQLLNNPAQALAQEIDPPLFKQKADDLLSRHPLRLGHRGTSSRLSLARPDESERRGGRTTRLRPTRSYTTLRDVTAISASSRDSLELAAPITGHRISGRACG